MRAPNSRYLVLLAILTLAGASLWMSACGDDGNPTNPNPPANLPAELVGDWAMTGATVNGAPQCMEVFFDWDPATTGDMLSIAANGSFTEQELAADRSVTESSTGTITVTGSQMTVTQAGTPPEVVFDGDWTLQNHTLRLRQVVDGDEIVMLLHQLITVNIDFQVRSVDDTASLLGGTITEGMQGSGFYTYDPTVIDTNTSSTVGDYDNALSPCGIFLDLGGMSFQTNLSHIDFLVEIVNDHNGRDTYLLRSSNNLPANANLLAGNIYWQMDDETMAALDDIALPLTPPVLASWTQSFGLRITGSDLTQTNSYSITCTVTTATLGG